MLQGAIEELTNEVLQLKNQLVLVNAQRATTAMNIERQNQVSITEYESLVRNKDQQIYELVSII